MELDYYAVLGVSKSASDSEIKSAYRKLAREWHPDVAKDKPDSEERFKEINEAYQVLGDSGKRKQYDQYGHAAFGGNRSGGGGGANPFEGMGGMGGFGPFSWSYQSSAGQGGDSEYQDPFDIFEQVFGFRGFGGAKKGRNLRYTMSIDFEDSIRGFEKVIEINGHKLKLKLPSGVSDETTVRFAGKGEKSQRGGENGDLLISIHINQSDKFIRQGNDLYSSEVISFKDAILGGQAEIDVVDPQSKTAFSTKQLKIPEGTQPDTIIKVKGYGMPNPKGYGRGDLYVTINIQIPKNLNKNQKKILFDNF